MKLSSPFYPALLPVTSKILERVVATQDFNYSINSGHLGAEGRVGIHNYQDQGVKMAAAAALQFHLLNCIWFLATKKSTRSRLKRRLSNLIRKRSLPRQLGKRRQSLRMSLASGWRVTVQVTRVTGALPRGGSRESCSHPRSTGTCQPPCGGRARRWAGPWAA